MASSFLTLRFVIPKPDNTELTVTAAEESLWSLGGMETAGAKRFMIRPLPGLRFRMDQSCRHQKLGCARVAEFAGLVRNLPS